MLLKFFAADIVKLICKKFCWIMCYVLTVSIWCPIEEERLKTTFSAYFTVLLSKGQKCSSSKAKIMRCVRRRCIDRTPMQKLVCTISFRQFQSWGCITSWMASWSRCVQNKVVGRCKSSNNNSRDCRKIKSVKRDRSQAHGTSRLNSQACLIF